MSNSTVTEAAKSVWLAAGLPLATLPRLQLSGDPDLVINSSFRLGVAAQVG
jgi:hypothetical protein